MRPSSKAPSSSLISHNTKRYIPGVYEKVCLGDGVGRGQGIKMAPGGKCGKYLSHDRRDLSVNICCKNKLSAKSRHISMDYRVSRFGDSFLAK